MVGITIDGLEEYGRVREAFNIGENYLGKSVSDLVSAREVYDALNSSEFAIDLLIGEVGEERVHEVKTDLDILFRDDFFMRETDHMYDLFNVKIKNRNYKISWLNRFMGYNQSHTQQKWNDVARLDGCILPDLRAYFISFVHLYRNRNSLDKMVKQLVGEMKKFFLRQFRVDQIITSSEAYFGTGTYPSIRHNIGLKSEEGDSNFIDTFGVRYYLHRDNLNQALFGELNFDELNSSINWLFGAKLESYEPVEVVNRVSLPIVLELDDGEFAIDFCDTTQDSVAKAMGINIMHRVKDRNQWRLK